MGTIIFNFIELNGINLESPIKVENRINNGSYNQILFSNTKTNLKFYDRKNNILRSCNDFAKISNTKFIFENENAILNIGIMNFNSKVLLCPLVFQNANIYFFQLSGLVNSYLVTNSFEIKNDSITNLN